MVTLPRILVVNHLKRFTRFKKDPAGREFARKLVLGMGEEIDPNINSTEVFFEVKATCVDSAPRDSLVRQIVLSLTSINHENAPSFARAVAREEANAPTESKHLFRATNTALPKALALDQGGSHQRSLFK